MNFEDIRKDFVILDQQIHDEPLVYLDNAATTQKPRQVVEAMEHYYRYHNANVHRGVHTLSERATQHYEAARQKVADFIQAASSKEIIFTRGTTTALNWVAQFAGECLQAGDEVLISVQEHHSNIIPWQQVCQRTGARLRYIPIKDGSLDVSALESMLHSQVRFVSLAQVSNVLGGILPIREIAQMVHAVGAYLVVDGAQSVPHLPVNVRELDVDFLAFSGHKMLGPTGIGVLYGKQALLDQMSPIEFGGEMIEFVSEQAATWKELPWKFEAGTPLIAEAIGLGAAIDYLTAIGMDQVAAHSADLMAYLLPRLSELEGVTVYGTSNPAERVGLVTFTVDGLHPHDVATALDYEGVAVRAGHHCTQPLHKQLGLSASLRASVYLYTTREDCDRLIEALKKTKEFFNGTF